MEDKAVTRTQRKWHNKELRTAARGVGLAPANRLMARRVQKKAQAMFRGAARGNKAAMVAAAVPPVVDLAPHGAQPAIQALAQRPQRKRHWKEKDAWEGTGFGDMNVDAPIVSMVRDYHAYDRALAAGANPEKPKATLEIGAFRVAKIHTGYPFLDAIYNGIAHGECRYPDPFSFNKTTVYQTSNTTQFGSVATSASCSSTSYDWACYGWFKGSPMKTLMKPSAPVTPNWTARWASGTGTWYNTGLCSGDFYSRPVGMTIDIIPRMIGAAHTIKFYCFPLCPLMSTDVTTDAITGWPSDLTLGLSPAQVSWGGREFEIDPTSKGIRLCCLPWDSRCFDFMQSDQERSTITQVANIAWSGWVWWASGMSQSDKFDIVLNTVEESAYKTIGTATQYAQPQSTRVSNSAMKDKLVNGAQALANDGLAAYQIISDVVNIAKSVWGAGKKIAAGLGLVAGVFSPLPMLPEPEDEKRDDPVLLESDRAQLVQKFVARNSINNFKDSLMSSSSSTPRATK